MAHILRRDLWASKLVGEPARLGDKVQIKAGMAIDLGEDNPAATTIVINFNGEKYLTDKAILEKAIRDKSA